MNILSNEMENKFVIQMNNILTRRIHIISTLTPYFVIFIYVLQSCIGSLSNLIVNRYISFQEVSLRKIGHNFGIHLCYGGELDDPGVYIGKVSDFILISRSSGLFYFIFPSRFLSQNNDLVYKFNPSFLWITKHRLSDLLCYDNQNPDFGFYTMF